MPYCEKHQKYTNSGKPCPTCAAVAAIVDMKPEAIRNFAVRGALQSEPTMQQAPATDAPTAKKMDDGKIPVFQGFSAYFPRAIFAVALVSEYGKRKYAPDAPVFNTGWAEVANGLNRYMDADERHKLKHSMGLFYDDESEMAHLAHKAWNALAELERALRDGVVELRRGVDIVDGKPVPGTHKLVELK